jgi:hypothetical protein
MYLRLRILLYIFGVEQGSHGTDCAYCHGLSYES